MNTDQHSDKKQKKNTENMSHTNTNDSQYSKGSKSASVVLIKKIPVNTTEEEVKEKLINFGNILRVKLLMHKNYAYVEFEKSEQAKKCVEHFSNAVLTINGDEVLVYLTSSGKNENKPLDLNPPSNILLLTFFKNKVEINIKLVLEMMDEFDVVEKVCFYVLIILDYCV